MTGPGSVVGDAVHIRQIGIDLEARVFLTLIGTNSVFPKWDIERFHESPLFGRK